MNEEGGLQVGESRGRHGGSYWSIWKRWAAKPKHGADGGVAGASEMTHSRSPAPAALSRLSGRPA